MYAILEEKSNLFVARRARRSQPYFDKLGLFVHEQHQFTLEEALSLINTKDSLHWKLFNVKVKHSIVSRCLAEYGLALRPIKLNKFIDSEGVIIYRGEPFIREYIPTYFRVWGDNIAIQEYTTDFRLSRWSNQCFDSIQLFLLRKYWRSLPWRGEVPKKLSYAKGR